MLRARAHSGLARGASRLTGPRILARGLSHFDLYGAQHTARPNTHSQPQYSHEVYRPEEAASTNGAQTGAAAGAGTGGAGAAFAAGPTPNPRSMLLSDMSRVLLGLSLVLQHSSALSGSRVSAAASAFAAENERSPPPVAEVARILKDRLFTHPPPPAPISPHSPADSTTTGAQPQPQPQPGFPFPSSLPSFVQHSVDMASSVATHTLNQLRAGSTATPTFPSPPADFHATAQQVAQNVHSAVGGAIGAQNLDHLTNHVGQGVQRVGQHFNQLLQQQQPQYQQQPQQPAQQQTQTPPTPAPVATPAPVVTQPEVPSVLSQPKVSAIVQDYENPVAATAPPMVAGVAREVSQAPVISPKSAAADASAKLAREAQQQQQQQQAAHAADSSKAATSASTGASAKTSVPSSSSSSSTSANASGSSTTSFHTGFQPRERAVPASPLARIAGFSQIASNIFFGTIKDKVTGAFAEPTGTDKKTHAAETGATGTAAASSGSSTVLGSFLSEANTERLAEGLCRMRGAALKVGQMLSIQDESLVPPQLQAVLDRVRDGADVMPRHQLEKALLTELGPHWMDSLSEFDWKPMAAASIGQVHRARLKSNGQEVVMKVQYPGVAESINSDVNNLKRLIRFVNVLPKGMYIDETMRAAKEELALECDYSNEALAQKKFKKLAEGDKAFYIPQVIESLSTKRILTTERVYGVAIDRLVSTLPSGPSHGPEKIVVSEATRNSICKSLLRLCLAELFQYRFMQTDPNWSNFLYNPQNNLIYLIDFGASRLYRKEFVDEYLRMVYACSVRDRRGIIESNIKLGFLTGEESKEMIEATVQAGYIIGEPFGSEAPYDFGEGNIAGRVSALANVMLRDRLTPPPKEAYTLHRKLSGAFLTCKHLGAKIQCRDDFLRVYKTHQFGPELPLVFCSASKNAIESRLTPE